MDRPSSGLIGILLLLMSNTPKISHNRLCVGRGVPYSSAACSGGGLLARTISGTFRLKI